MPHSCRSSGVVSWPSTSPGLAPGNGTITSTIGTTICGSSSRGVSATAPRPSRIDAITIKGVSLLERNARARRPAGPSGAWCRSPDIGHLDRRAVDDPAWIFDHQLTRAQAGADRDAVVLGLAQREPAQLGAALAGDEYAGEIAALDQRGAWHPERLAAAGRQDEARESPAAQARRGAEDASAN